MRQINGYNSKISLKSQFYTLIGVSLHSVVGQELISVDYLVNIIG